MRHLLAANQPPYAQDEVKFYVGDAASKLLLVPARGNREAEKAAAELNVPIATVSVSWTEGRPDLNAASTSHCKRTWQWQ